MKLELFRVIQPVRDIESAARFYAKVFGMAGERVSPGRHYFRCGDAILACYDPLADGDDLGRGWHHHANQYMYFATDDLEVIYARVSNAGGSISSPIESMPWGERLFYAKDPFGNPIAFVDRKTVYRGAAPQRT
jgi:predicted enzyme related to lactoylglutathione lyase